MVVFIEYKVSFFLLFRTSLQFYGHVALVLRN